MQIFEKTSYSEYINEEEKILSFLNKIIELNGNESFILIQLFNFSKKNRNQLYKQLKNQNQKQNIEMNCIEKNLIDSIIDIEEEKIKMNEYYECKFANLYKNVENKIDEISTKFINEMNEQKRYHNKQVNYLKRIIIDINNFYSDPDYEKFNKLQAGSQHMIISNIYNKKENQKQEIQNIYNLVNYLWKSQQNSKNPFDNNQLIYIQTSNNNQQFSLNKKIKKIIIPIAMIKILISNSSIYETKFINFINKFENIYVDIQYPSNEYQQIIDTIIQIKKSNEFKLQTEIRIISINEQENPIQHNEYIDSIIIEKPNEIIPCKYFETCTSLKKVLIPKSVIIIEKYSFKGCTSLTNITIPKSVTKIGNYSFSGCTNLTNVTIPESVTNIGDYLFSGCTNLIDIIIPKSVVTIGDYSFSGCTSLTNITIPKSVVTIGNYSFSGCTALTNLVIPFTTESVGEYCFEGCFGLKKVIIDLYHTIIENNTFKDIQLKEIIT